MSTGIEVTLENIRQLIKTRTYTCVSADLHSIVYQAVDANRNLNRMLTEN